MPSLGSVCIANTGAERAFRDVILRIVNNDDDIGNSEYPATNNLLDTIVNSSSG
jgi:hypothetical protein